MRLTIVLPAAVSPVSFQHVSTSGFSTSGLFSLDGTSRHLFSPSPPPPRPRSAPCLDMAVKPAHNTEIGHQDYRTDVKSPPRSPKDALEASNEPVQNRSEPQPIKDALSYPVPSLLDLSQGLRSENHHRRECLQLQGQLHQVHLIAVRTTRLLHIARSIQRTLGECIKAEDKHSFVSLFNAFRDAVSGCLELPGSPDYCAPSEGDCVGYPASYVDVLHASPRTTLLDFILKVKHDGSFIADRLAALTHKELVALLPEKGQSRSTESIFGSSPRTSSRTSKHLGFVADGQTDLLSSFDFSSPLETLVLAVRGLSNVPLYRDPVATEVWATVCARLISEHKPGSERLVPALIDLWAFSSGWPAKERLSLWMCDVLQDGVPLLEQDSKRSFRVRAGLRQDQDKQQEALAEGFYLDSVDSLLALLADPSGPSVIPEGARTFCHAICRRLDGSANHRHVFPNFVLNRWLFASFIPDALTLPEAGTSFQVKLFTD
jgi:hypothetical protein